MRYLLKQKLWSFTDSFNIYNANQQAVYQVKGKPFSWGDQLSFQDMSGRELATISQKLFTFMPKYELYKDGQLFAEIIKEFSWFRSQFTLDVPGPNDYAITGSFWEREYTFVRQKQVVATVSKKFWSWADTYGVDILDGEDDIAILATVVVIDLVLHDEDGRSTQ
ncbi:MAG: LURP-one-related family protein [Anaerolineales bacterium]|nr:LURP-one-related family protein [Anaerolineales bacterium]